MPLKRNEVGVVVTKREGNQLCLSMDLRLDSLETEPKTGILKECTQEKPEAG